MNLIIINHKKMSYLFNKINGEGFYFIYDSTKMPINSLKSHILENNIRFSGKLLRKFLSSGETPPNTLIRQEIFQIIKN